MSARIFTGKLGNQVSAFVRLEDMKKLYDGFDLMCTVDICFDDD